MFVVCRYSWLTQLRFDFVYGFVKGLTDWAGRSRLTPTRLLVWRCGRKKVFLINTTALIYATRYDAAKMLLEFSIWFKLFTKRYETDNSSASRASCEHVKLLCFHLAFSSVCQSRRVFTKRVWLIVQNTRARLYKGSKISTSWIVFAMRQV